MSRIFQLWCLLPFRIHILFSAFRPFKLPFPHVVPNHLIFSRQQFARTIISPLLVSSPFPSPSHIQLCQSPSQSTRQKPRRLTSIGIRLLLRHRLLRPLSLRPLYQTLLLLIFVIDMSNFQLGFYRRLVVDAVEDSGAEGTPA